MITLDIDYIFTKAGGVRGLLTSLDQHCPGHNIPYSTIQMWKQRKSIPSAWIGAVLYVMGKERVSLNELLTDTDELCEF